MKNRVSLEGYGEILAGRIARPYEKGTPRAKQGDEYWFFIKHFALISREKASKGEGWRWREQKKENKKKGGRKTERKRQRVRKKERRDGRRRERGGHLCSASSHSQVKERETR